MVRVKDLIELLNKVPEDWECSFTRTYGREKNKNEFIVKGSHTFDEGLEVENIRHPLFEIDED